MTPIAPWKPYSPSATCPTVEDTARMDNSRLVIWNPLYRAEPAGVNKRRPAQRRAAEITEQMSVTGSEGTGQGLSEAAAADTDPTGEVEAAGHFRIYLGAAPGVGKTYAMLSEGQRRRGRGADVVAGFVEAYGRPRTEEPINGLEVIPRKAVNYRGTRLEEMDLDAVLRRRPEIALVDELAHTNVPGSGRHGKRWQDILDILGAGIDVITTVNIQHLESIADKVEQMTGTPVRERVPDWVLRKANQIELIDSSPEQLRRRMLHGNIYPKQKVPQALTHFFRPRQPDRLAGAGAAVRCRRVGRRTPRAPAAAPASGPVGDDRAHHGGRHRSAGDRRAATARSTHRIQGQRGTRGGPRHRRRHRPVPGSPVDRQAARADSRPRRPLARDRR
jgi:Osmosensitive K+ channel His kinase sensor domain